MSELYDRVVKLIRSAADQPVARGAETRHQYLVINPKSWAEIHDEMTNLTDPAAVDKMRMTWSPEPITGIGIILDEELHPDLLLLRTEEHF